MLFCVRWFWWVLVLIKFCGVVSLVVNVWLVCWLCVMVDVRRWCLLGDFVDYLEKMVWVFVKCCFVLVDCKSVIFILYFFCVIVLVISILLLLCLDMFVWCLVLILSVLKICVVLFGLVFLMLNCDFNNLVVFILCWNVGIFVLFFGVVKDFKGDKVDVEVFLVRVIVCFVICVIVLNDLVGDIKYRFISNCLFSVWKRILMWEVVFLFSLYGDFFRVLVNL